MKKIILILVLLLILVPNVKAEDEVKFVNPIFYQPLEPLSRVSTWTYLTPTSIKSMTPLDKNKVAMTGQCELVENQQDHITMLCDIFWHNPEGKGGKVLISFILKDLYTSDCLRVEESYRSLSEEYPSISSYCVTPPDDNPSESDRTRCVSCPIITFLCDILTMHV